MPAPGTNPAGIISPAEYDQYAANWLVAASDPAGTVLAQSFVWNKELMSSLTFSARQIARLVSTVGATTIKARFLIMYDDKAQPHFTLALFATDALDTRVSSYYVADYYWRPAQPAPTPAPASKLNWNGRVRALARYDTPDVLTSLWLAAWRKLKRVSPALFATQYGPLRGYSYGVEEFVALLREIKSVEDEKVLMEFDLHEYYQTQPVGDVLVQTFGLLLWTVRGKSRSQDGESKSGDPVPEGLNMGGPCPPVC